MVNNNMNIRRSQVVEGGNAFGCIMDNFHDLSPEQQKISVIGAAYEIGNLGKMKHAEKI